MRGNKLLYSNYKAERVKGYKKLIKKQTVEYTPPKNIVQDIVEAMAAQDYEVSKKEVDAYLQASYAAFDRRYFMESKR
tara:strand:+ start:435 stop:668 length:234 start_codon:yes stop_codon:yes gene_type:complete